MPRTVAIVPFRDPRDGKQRLRKTLNDLDRWDLAGAMLTDVLSALSSLRGMEVLIAAGTAEAGDVADRLGVPWMRDPSGEDMDLNRAVGHARHRLGPSVDTLVVMADLPSLRPSEIRAILDREADVVIAPSADGGTSALLARSGRPLPPLFGPGSAGRHRYAALSRGYVVECLTLPGCLLDVDTARDLDRAPTSLLGRRTRSVMGRLPSGATTASRDVPVDSHRRSGVATCR
jgi:2-phospho-L-lactate/phosphoenolpyruvate guanylyltransferase